MTGLRPARHLRLGLSVLAAAAIAGCGSGQGRVGSSSTTGAPRRPVPSRGATTSGPPSTAGPEGSTTPPPGATSPTTSSPSPTTSGPGAPAECVTGQLRAAVAAPRGTAGTTYYRLEMRNTGSSPCFVEGYAGVSFVAGPNGPQVGAAGRRVAAPTPAVVIQPGGEVAAVLGVVDAGNFGASCSVTPVGGIRVYPPDQRTALFVAHPFEACANARDVTLTIRPFGAGPG